MDAEVHHAPAAREARVLEPRLVRSVRVVKDEVGRVHAPERALLHEPPELRDAGDVAVRQVDPEQPVGGARGVHDPARLRRRPGERLLAEHRDPALEGADGLLGVQRRGGRDDDAVEPEREELVERGGDGAAGSVRGRGGRGVGRRVGDRGGAGVAGLHDRAQPVAADPADAEEAEPRAAG